MQELILGSRKDLPRWARSIHCQESISTSLIDDSIVHRGVFEVVNVGLQQISLIEDTIAIVKRVLNEPSIFRQGRILSELGIIGHIRDDPLVLFNE